VTLALSALAYACGGDDTTVNPVDSGGGGADGSADATTDAGSGETGGQDSGGTPDGGGDDATGGDGSTNDGGGDAGKESGAIDPGIFCGQGKYCKTIAEICCADQNTQTPNDKCQPANQPCGQGQASIHCDDSADCVGGVCCGFFNNGQYTDVVCQSQCSQTQFQFCDPTSDAGPGCPQQTSCQTSQVLQGFHICR
jgi:hypothetical protein